MASTSVKINQLTPGTDGDLLTWDASGNPTTLATVSAGSYLRSNGTGAAPIWSTLKLPNTVSAGDILVANSANNLTTLSGVASGNALISTGTGSSPVYGKIGLSTHVSGTLPIGSGGTNITTYAAGDILYASATNVLSKLSAGTDGHVLTLASGLPSWAAAGGSDGNGIYSGSDTLANSNTVATLPNAGTLTFAYNNAVGAVAIFDNTGVVISADSNNAFIYVTNDDVDISANSGARVHLNGADLELQGSGGNIYVGGDATASALRFYEPGGTSYIGLQAPSIGGDISFTLPSADAAGVMKSNGSGTLSLAAISNTDLSSGVGGIYKGSGTIAAATVATVTSGSNFLIDFDGSNPALGIYDNLGSAYLTNKATTGTAGVSATEAGLSFGENSLLVNATHTIINNPFVMDGSHFALDSDVTPSEITSNQNNYGPTDSDAVSVLRLSSDASRTITGLAPGGPVLNGRIIILNNIGSNDIILADQSASSSDVNRFALGANFTLLSNETVSLIYDETAERWRPLHPLPNPGTSGIYGGSGTIGTAAVATIAAGSTFTIDYNGGVNALSFGDSLGTAYLADKTFSQFVSVGSTEAGISAGSNSLFIGPSAGTQINNDVRIYNGHLSLEASLTPSQITSDQNNYAPTGINTTSILRLSTDASRTVTGIAIGGLYMGGRILIILNIGANDLILAHEDVSSTAANRFSLGGADVTLEAGQSIALIYDSSTARWRNFSFYAATDNNGIYGGSGTISGTTTATISSGGEFAVTFDSDTGGLFMDYDAVITSLSSRGGDTSISFGATESVWSNSDITATLQTDALLIEGDFITRIESGGSFRAHYSSNDPALLVDDTDASITLYSPSGLNYVYVNDTSIEIVNVGNIALIAAPTSDHSFSGSSATFTANENQAIGDVCYINADGEAQLGDASAVGTSYIMLMAAESITADTTGVYIQPGSYVRDDSWAWTPGEPIYLSVTGTTGSTLTQTAPSGGDVVYIIGMATHADRIFFNPTFTPIVTTA